jgi:hypothetical protein
LEGKFLEKTMKKKHIAALIIFLGMLFISTSTAYAQENAYNVSVRKDFGYSWANDIQGRFSISLVGDEANVDQVTFYIDDEILSTVRTSPFRYQFTTDDFSAGAHQLYAEVQLRDGSSQLTPALIYDFLDRKAANQQLVKVLVGIGGAMLAVFGIVALVQTLFMKGRKKSTHTLGTPRSYGLLGGTICPKCGKPFPRHIWGMNLMVGRLDRCENCGKWVMTMRATPEALRLAEEAELDQVNLDETETPHQHKVREDLDETKYFNGL